MCPLESKEMPHADYGLASGIIEIEYLTRIIKA